MKKILVLAAFMLLATGQVWGKTIAEAEAELVVRAGKYAAHPLYKYMVPTGAKAIWNVLRTVRKRCRVESAFDNEECIAQRNAAAELLTSYGFENVSSDDFKDEELFKMASQLAKVYKAKRKYFSKKTMTSPIKERKQYRVASETLFKDSLDMHSDLINGKR